MTPTITLLLQAAGQGDTRAFDQLYALVYDELRRLAHVVRQGKAGNTLNTTALVHEAYFKLLKTPGNVAWSDRVHFFRIAARAMRQVLANAAQERMTQKRGGKALTITLNEMMHAGPIQPEIFLLLHEALHRLETINKRQADVVECRFFASLTVEETAAALGISDTTVKRDWRYARAWLGKEMKRDLS